MRRPRFRMIALALAIASLCATLVAAVNAPDHSAAMAPTDKPVLGIGFVARKNGYKISLIYQNGPAYKAGLRPGDLILKINGKPVSGLPASDILEMVAAKDPVTLEIQDGPGKTKTLTISKVLRSVVMAKSGGVPLSAMDEDLAQWKPGDVPTDFTVQSSDGKQSKLSDCGGKVVAVVFWAGWNSACETELPFIQQIYAKYHARGLEMLGVNMDQDQADMDRFMGQKHIRWPQHFDGRGFGGGVVKEWAVTTLPAIFLIGKDGKIVATSLNHSTIEEAVQSALGK